MEWTDQQRDFLQKNRGAAMITLRADGTPAAVRVGIALVNGKLWSSGTQDRARTRHLRRDPRSTLFVFESPGFLYMSIESRVTILEGPDAPQLNLQLFRIMQARPVGPLSWFGNPAVPEADFLQKMTEEKRLIYRFEPVRVVGGSN